MSDLAYALNRDGDREAAAALYEKLIATNEKLFGTESFEVVAPMQFLAFVREDQDDPASAIDLARRAAAATAAALGPEHPETFTSQSILAGLLRRTKEEESVAEAERIYSAVLEGRIATLGASQPDTLSTFENLADVLTARGDTQGARKLTLRRLDAMGKAVGSDNTGYAFELFVAASQFFLADDNTTALPLAERCFLIREDAFGIENKETQAALQLLVSINRALGNTEDAEELSTRLIPDES
jgi:tetratricopeptide (TPR) repeat protein